MKHIAAMFLWVGLVCTVNYPSDCTVINTQFTVTDNRFKAQVECSYEDGSRSHYFALVKRTEALNASMPMAKVDYLPSVALTDSTTMSCQ